MEIITKEDLVIVIPMGAIQKICFDKAWSKIVSLKKAEIKKEGSLSPLS
jgi:hypothetical protein